MCDVSYPPKTKLKIRWLFVTDCVKISDKFKKRLLPSAIAFIVDLCFLYLHINRTLKAVNVFTAGIFMFNFFYPEVKNLKLCPFVTNDLLQILSTSQIFNYCWPLLKLPLAFLLKLHGRLLLSVVSSKGWRWVFWLSGCFVLLQSSKMLRTSHIIVEFLSLSYIFPNKCFLRH